MAYYLEKFLIHLHRMQAGEFQSLFLYTPEDQAVWAEVQPNHWEVGTSLTCIILYTERELDLREFHGGGILKV
jgi:hypothetical protein